MPIAGYVHCLYLRLDNKLFLFSDIPVFDTLSFEAILGLSAHTKYALNFDNKPDGTYFSFFNEELRKCQIKGRTKQSSVSQQNLTALAPKLVLSPWGGEGSVPSWEIGIFKLKWLMKNTIFNYINLPYLKMISILLLDILRIIFSYYS